MHRLHVYPWPVGYTCKTRYIPRERSLLSLRIGSAEGEALPQALTFSLIPIVSFPDPERARAKKGSGDNTTCCLTLEGRDHNDVISRFQMKMANSTCLMMPSKAVRDILCTNEGSTPLCVVLGCIYQVYFADT